MAAVAGCAHVLHEGGAVRNASREARSVGLGWVRKVLAPWPPQASPHALGLPQSLTPTSHPLGLLCSSQPALDRRLSAEMET